MNLQPRLYRDEQDLISMRNILVAGKQAAHSSTP
jgi:hypothetical protein